jgi:hypothetical protein
MKLFPKCKGVIENTENTFANFRCSGNLQIYFFKLVD